MEQSMVKKLVNLSIDLWWDKLDLNSSVFLHISEIDDSKMFIYCSFSQNENFI